MSLTSDFVRGFGSIVDLSGRSLEPEHPSTETLFDQLFGSALSSTDTGDSEERYPSQPKRIQAEIAEVASLYQFAMRMIAETSEAMDFALQQIPEQQRGDILPALSEVRKRGILAITDDLEVRLNTLLRSQQIDREEAGRLAETLHPRAQQ
ncbi:MAG: hypothetical protein ACR2GH_01390 [Pseudonocardia sp.]